MYVCLLRTWIPWKKQNVVKFLSLEHDPVIKGQQSAPQNLEEKIPYVNDVT